MKRNVIIRTIERADPATVSVPFRPGVTYVATGRGCAAWAMQPASPPCQILGPLTAAL